MEKKKINKNIEVIKLYNKTGITLLYQKREFKQTIIIKKT
jgi:hypothetical protein